MRSALIGAVLVMVGNARPFMDDTGRLFDFVGKPKIAVRAGVGALSLYHFGISAEQVTAVWGLWYVRGSNFDIDNPEAGSLYTDIDPTPDEVEFLKSAVNLSPNCFNNKRGCFQWDSIDDVIAVKDEIDYIIYIDNGADQNFETAEADSDIPVVFIDTWFEYNPNCRFNNFSLSDDNKACVGRSMIDIARRIEELAIALGADPTHADEQKTIACKSASRFTEAMKTAHDKGIRIKGSTFGVVKDFRGTDVVYVQDLDPLLLWVLRTMEELGAPVLHGSDSNVIADDYFIGCPPGRISVSCNDATLFPVDFWIVDSRSYAYVNTDTFENIFPDKAIITGQHYHYARNDGAVSYISIAKVLDEISQRIKTAKRQHEETDCTPVDPKAASVTRRSGGLDQNQYICYNRELIQKEYIPCIADSGQDRCPRESVISIIMMTFIVCISLNFFF